MAVGNKISEDDNIFSLDGDRSNNFLTSLYHKLTGSVKPNNKANECFSKLSNLIKYNIGKPGKFIRTKLGHENFNFPASRKLLKLKEIKPDIIHFHNLHGEYFDLNYLKYLSNFNSLVFTLHDTWLFTGHCANFIGCNRWTNGCGMCPDLNLWPPIERDATSHNLRKKSNIYNNCKIYLTSPSEWLMNKVTQSVLYPSVIESKVIRNGIDKSLFCPYDKFRARKELGLPADSKIILHVSKGFINNPYKGYQTFLSTVKKIAHHHDEPILFLVLGDVGKILNINNVSLKFLDYIDKPEIVARYYQAADIYLHTSRADNFPLAILESIACGLPVVATEVGGVTEQINNNVNGYLVPSGDSEAIAYHISRIISDEKLRRRLSDNCIKKFKSSFTIEQMAENYLEWYEYILERNN